jgi:hypothetical protein
MNRKQMLKWFSVLMIFAFIPYIYFHMIAPHPKHFDELGQGLTRQQDLPSLLTRQFSQKSPPWYFARWGVTFQLDHLFEDYARWHQEQLRILKANGCRSRNETIDSPNVLVFRPWESSMCVL